MKMPKLQALFKNGEAQTKFIKPPKMRFPLHITIKNSLLHENL